MGLRGAGARACLTSVPRSLRVPDPEESLVEASGAVGHCPHLQRHREGRRHLLIPTLTAWQQSFSKRPLNRLRSHGEPSPSLSPKGPAPSCAAAQPPPFRVSLLGHLPDSRRRPGQQEPCHQTQPLASVGQQGVLEGDMPDECGVSVPRMLGCGGHCVRAISTFTICGPGPKPELTGQA